MTVPTRPKNESDVSAPAAPESPAKPRPRLNTKVVKIDPARVARRTIFGFRHDRAVLAFVTRGHRLMTMRDCAAEALRRFGYRAPSKSAIGRYWLWLDEQLGLREPPASQSTNRSAA